MYFNNMKYISRFLFMQAFFPFFVEEKLINNNMKYISRFLFMQAFFPFFVEEKLIFVIGKINRESYG